MTVAPHLPRMRKAGRIDLTVFKGADHTFTERRHQAQIVDLVSEWLA
jgi:dipeptidyl aminopeptidase/acylaminoacyl peptidase